VRARPRHQETGRADVGVVGTRHVDAPAYGGLRRGGAGRPGHRHRRPRRLAGARRRRARGGRHAVDHGRGGPVPDHDARHQGRRPRRPGPLGRCTRVGGTHPRLQGGLMATEKITSLADLAARVPDGASLSLGGSFLHRGPFAFVRELVRQGRENLEIVKQSAGYDIDLLCRASRVTRARAGIVAMEGNFGLAPWYRRAVERGEVALEEHACASLTAGLRAAAFGVPFQPCGGLHGSALPELNGWQEILDPYGSGRPVWVIPEIKPDV